MAEEAVTSCALTAHLVLAGGRIRHLKPIALRFSSRFHRAGFGKTMALARNDQAPFGAKHERCAFSNASQEHNPLVWLTTSTGELTLRREFQTSAQTRRRKLMTVWVAQSVCIVTAMGVKVCRPLFVRQTAAAQQRVPQKKQLVF